MKAKRERLAPGDVRDAIVRYLRTVPDASTSELVAAVSSALSEEVSSSSVRSYLRLNTPARFRRVRRGRYALQSDR